ncbi:MAG: HNH endonuclease signature motif containing protein [Persephonella sp.]|nr:HNH endonuclease signature motif containing protein [Persephonella sp.]
MKGKIVYRFGDEILKQIEDFLDYAVSNKGFVYRGIKQGLLPESYREFRKKTFIGRKGFHTVQLSDGKRKKVYYLHRLIAEYFVPNPEGYRYVIHKDGNRNNNSADNLIWVPFVNRKADEELKSTILSLTAKGKSYYQISKDLNISIQKVMKIAGKRDMLSIALSPQTKDKLLKLAEKGVLMYLLLLGKY